MGTGASAATSEIHEASAEELSAVVQKLPAEAQQKLLAAFSQVRGGAIRSLAPEKLESASEILRAIHEKKVSCVEVVEKCLARIRATDSELRACPEVLGEEAIAKAKAVDDKIAKGEASLGPLEGLPIVVKINVDLAGTLSTASNPVLDNWRPSTTAPIAQALLDAGAIIVAKTNMPLMARQPECLSPLHGMTRNPLNLSYSPSGSSSGTAAAIAAGMVSCGIGSDTGGSCRLPAICCGLVGFRPSPGRYSLAGIVPCVGPADTAGPLGTSVGDVMLLDTAITGTKHDTEAVAGDLLKDLTIATPADWVAEDGLANKTNKVSWDAAIGALGEKGVKFVKDDMGDELLMKHAFVNITKSSFKELDAYLESHRKADPPSTHSMLQLSTKEFVEKTGCGEEKIFRTPNDDAEKAAAEEEGLKAATAAAEEAVAAYFKKADAKFLLTPGMVGLPLNIDKAELEASGKIVGRTYVSETGFKEVSEEARDAFRIVLRYAVRFAGHLTSIAIPTPVRCQATGLPTGVILWAPRDADKELLQVAAAVEAAISAIDVSKFIVSY